VAAKIRRELKTEVTMTHGRYGEFRILVDGKEAIAAGKLAALGVLPSTRKILAAVKARLASTPA
jgi:hypothetical protein